ncbi:MAG TPA: MerR family transcriptional regulator [Bacteroidales bacterium]|nr:MerR family transcriptional regulator [Bacteroidales bacterium]
MRSSINKAFQGNSNPVYTLSVASTLSEIPVHSIKQYISKGLILPYVKESGRHLFSGIDILRLKSIRCQLEEKGLNIAGIKAILSLIPCWAVHKCPESDRNICDAYNSTSYPCWEASEKGEECRNRECRECGVYSVLSENHDVKTLLRELVQ